ncbi:hypothetical protein C4559_02305 [Candidatus Microgenomates bacterium]|nr:MAG: hypothetical protein C4559_02305 [Candidatus Microgenomates bacterium]
MFLKILFLQNFRSYSKSEFNFNKKTTLIVGPNTSGKSNIIESIYLLSTGKSFRAGKDFEMIRFGEEMGRVKAQIQNSKFKIQNCEGEEPFSSFPGEKTSNTLEDLEVVLTTGLVSGIATPLKKYLLNGVSKRRVNFASNLKTVLFSPQNLDIIIGSPSLRRNFLDEVLEQADQEYRLAIINYFKALRQRNALLEKAKDTGYKNEKLFEYWDDFLIKNGEVITKKREQLIEFINKEEKEIFNFQAIYDHSIISKERLLQYKDAELWSGVTLVGPHRDDINIRIDANMPGCHAEFISASKKYGSGILKQVQDNKVQVKDINNKIDIKYFGSRGQQRLAILQLKMLQILYIEKASNDRPLLLLDDIFSELDEGHINLVLKMIQGQQTIITTTHKDFIPENLLKDVHVVELRNNGRI